MHIYSTQRKAKVARAIEAREYLKQQFPQTFKQGHQKQPLAITIYQELISHFRQTGNCLFSDTELYHGLRFYQNSTEYLRNHWPGARRLNLQGQAAGIVTTTEAVQAQRTVALRWSAKHKASIANVHSAQQILYKNMLLQKIKLSSN